MAMASYAEVLKAAHRLPPTAQAKLATALLRRLKPPASGQQQLSDASELNPLRGMSLAELQVLAEAVMAPAHQKALTRLLEKNRIDSLAPEEEAALDELLAQADQIGLLKARAQYTLRMLAETGESPS